MAISFSEFANGRNNNTGASSIATSGSISPTSNALVEAFLLQVNESGTPPSAPSGSGNSLTWVNDETGTFTDGASFTGRGTFVRAMGASPSAGSPSFSFGGTNDAAALWTGEATGVDTTGSNGSGAIVQSEQATGSNNAPTVSLAAFADATNNGTLFCAFWGGAAANSTPEAGFTGGTEVDTLTSYGLRVQWRTGADTSPAATLSATPGQWMAIAAEIKDAGGGAPAGHPTMRRLGLILGGGNPLMRPVEFGRSGGFVLKKAA